MMHGGKMSRELCYAGRKRCPERDRVLPKALQHGLEQEPAPSSLCQVPFPQVCPKQDKVTLVALWQ